MSIALRTFKYIALGFSQFSAYVLAFDFVMPFRFAGGLILVTVLSLIKFIFYIILLTFLNVLESLFY